MTMKRIIKAMSLLLALTMLAACGAAHKIDVPDDAVQITISQYAYPETATAYTDTQSINRLVDYMEGLSLTRHKPGVGVDSDGWYITVTTFGGETTEYMIDVDDWGSEIP